MRYLSCPRRTGAGRNFDSGLPHETGAAGMILNVAADRSFFYPFFKLGAMMYEDVLRHLTVTIMVSLLPLPDLG